jgi:hypothetical protein
VTVHLFAYGSLVSPESLAATIGGAVPAGRGPLTAVTFVPRPGAVERLVRARLAGTAVVRAGCEDLVADAFRRLGPGQAEAFARTTAPHGLRGIRDAGRVRR